MKIETSTITNRPIEEVFAVVSNHENYPKWDPAAIEVKNTSSGSIGLTIVVRVTGYQVNEE